MHRLARVAAGVIAAAALSSCSTASPPPNRGVAIGDGTQIIVLRPIDGSGKLASGWHVRPVRGNIAMNCTMAHASPYAVDAGVVDGCEPNTDNVLACFFVERNPGALCLPAPFDPRNRAVIQFPTAAHGAPAEAPAHPKPVAVELDDRTLCLLASDSRYHCANRSEAAPDRNGRWKVNAAGRRVVTTYYFGIAVDQMRLA